MTGKMIKCEGIPILITNDVVIATPEFYVSYNDRDIAIYGDVTTALVSTENDNPKKFFILNGDHTKEYQKIMLDSGSFLNCLKYFEENFDKMSKFSEI